MALIPYTFIRYPPSNKPESIKLDYIYYPIFLIVWINIYMIEKVVRLLMYMLISLVTVFPHKIPYVFGLLYLDCMSGGIPI